MTAAAPVDAAVNPNDSTQRYILWGNGRIDAIGGAPPITSGPAWYTLTYQPVGVALHITDWTTGAGYVLDLYGAAHPLNGAPALDLSTLGVPYTSPTRRYVDWSWDPGGSGHLVVLDHYGQLYAANGANAPARAGARFTWPAARSLAMSWNGGQPAKAITQDLYGGLHGDYGVTSALTPGGYWPGWDAARDLVVTDWTVTPPAGYTLDLYGGIHEFGGATQVSGGPSRVGADVARLLVVLSASNPLSLWEIWSRGEKWEWTVSTPPTVIAGGGVNEVQTVTVSGSPTGGSFTLTFSGQTTAAIAYNATAAAVQSALQALSNVGSGNVTVTGAGTTALPYTVTFVGALAQSDVAQMTATSSLTGGTSPAVTVATTTAGINGSPAATVTTTTRPTLAWSYSDPEQDSQAAWDLYVYDQTFVTGHDMTDPSKWATSALAHLSGTDPARRGAVADYDFPNGSYRFYVRAQDTSGKWSAWSNRGWTQNVPAPAAPTGLTAVADQGSFSVALSASCTTGGSADTVRFDCSDDGEVTWTTVRGAEAVTLAATTTATDEDPPLGVTRTYRAVAYANSPRVVSAASNTASATITTRTYVVRSADDPTLGGRLTVQGPVAWTRTAVAGVFEGVGAEFPTVASDGVPKAKRTTLHLASLDASTLATIDALAESDSTLVYRDPFGNVVYCRLVGDWGQSLMPGAALRSLHTIDLPLVEVAQPTTLPVASTVPPGPAGS